MRSFVRGGLFLGLPYVFLAQPLTDTSIRAAVASMTADGFSSTYGHISTWDVSRVTDMRELFKDHSSFNQSLDGWDVSSVTDMSYMFYGTD